MKSISNTRTDNGQCVWWVMTRTAASGVLTSRSFMYTHLMLENAHNGRQHAARALRRSRALLSAEVAAA